MADPVSVITLWGLVKQTCNGQLSKDALVAAIVQAAMPISTTDAREVREITDQLATVTGELGLEVTLFYLLSHCYTDAPLHLAAKRAREMLADHVAMFVQWTPQQRSSGLLASAIAVDGRIYALALKHVNLHNVLKMCLGRLHALYLAQYHAFLAFTTSKLVAHCWQCAAGGACTYEQPPFECRRVHAAVTSAGDCRACTSEAWCARHRDAVIDSTPALRYLSGTTDAVKFGRLLAVAGP